MVDDARADERISEFIKINAPRIARAVGVDFEFFRDGMESRHGRIHFDAGFGGFRNFYSGMGENAVRHVKPAVRSPGETVEQFVPIVQAETGHQNFARIGHVVVIFVLQKEKVGSLADVNAAVADENASGEIQAVGENCDLVRTAIVIGVL